MAAANILDRSMVDIQKQLRRLRVSNYFITRACRERQGWQLAMKLNGILREEISSITAFTTEPFFHERIAMSGREALAGPVLEVGDDMLQIGFL